MPDFFLTLLILSTPDSSTALATDHLLNLSSASIPLQGLHLYPPPTDSFAKTLDYQLDFPVCFSMYVRYIGKSLLKSVK